ncbi:MAG: thioredoxin family protein [Actinomycetota bacterium]
MTRLLILLALTVLVVAFAFWWRRREGHFVEADGSFEPSDLGLGRRDRKQATIVEFYGESCPPCDVVRKRLDLISEQVPGIRVVAINAGDRLDLSDKYQVRRVPTVFVTDERLRICWRASGVPSEHEIMSVLLGPEWAGRPHPDPIDSRNIF